jgi:cyclopropane-fatty-acyl-phospholipid synthase
MNAQAPTRGAELVTGGRTIGVGPQWLARLWSGGINAIIDRIDAGLERGAIEATLPDGSTRIVGGRQDGFACDVRLNSPRALLRLATGGSVGWYQAWEAGEWESRDPVALFALFMDNGRSLGNAARARGPWRMVARAGHWLKRNTRRGSLKNIHAHYDLGNDFYAAWLDPTLNYSSGIFGGEQLTLEEAQARKLEAIATRLALQPQASVLEIGCGWGSLAEHIASQEGADVRAISLSDEQLAYARHARNGAPGTVTFEKCDYRDVAGQFDAIASVEMVEAVGRAYWPEFLDCVARCLKPGGRAAIQYISIDDAMFDAYAASADFIQTYVFPGGMLLRETEFRRLAQERGLSWEDHASFGLDYAETLSIWRESFESAVDEGRLPPGFDEHFVRLWRYYLMYCEGGFRGGGIDVAQVTLVKD